MKNSGLRFMEQTNSNSLFTDMPIQARLCLLFFGALPVWSLLVMPLPHVLAADHGLLIGFVNAAAHFILPILLSIAIIKRSYVVLPFFLLECVALLTHTLLNPTGLPLSLQLTRVVLLAVGSLFGIALANRDFLYPLLSRSGRRWRASPRLALNARLDLYLGQKMVASVLMEDCSLTGMGIIIAAESLPKDLRTQQRSSALTVRYRSAAGTTEVPVRIVWAREHPAFIRMGMQALDGEAMVRLLESIRPPRSTWKFRHQLAVGWTKSGLRRAAFGSWLVAMALGVALPSCRPATATLNSSGELEPSSNAEILAPSQE